MQKHKILVVDDSKDNVIILRERLENEGFEISTAYSGEEAIKKALTESPDLILLDVMMPEMSGFEVCKRISGNEKTREIPIILLTALVEPKDIKEGFQAGAYDYIKKPFNKVELIARINSALRFRETAKLILDIEKINTFAASVVTTNHEIKQPLTLINLSVAALKREVSKDELNKQSIEKRISIIENAARDILKFLEVYSAIKKPVLTDYINNIKMIDLKKHTNENLNNGIDEIQ
ncbi:MAG: response regulator [Melioribacteraceae bacterium]|nr:response regulator [Melioribacteraceae bacterium]